MVRKVMPAPKSHQELQILKMAILDILNRKLVDRIQPGNIEVSYNAVWNFITITLYRTQYAQNSNFALSSDSWSRQRQAVESSFRTEGMPDYGWRYITNDRQERTEEPSVIYRLKCQPALEKKVIPLVLKSLDPIAFDNVAQYLEAGKAYELTYKNGFKQIYYCACIKPLYDDVFQNCINVSYFMLSPAKEKDSPNIGRYIWNWQFTCTTDTALENVKIIEILEPTDIRYPALKG